MIEEGITEIEFFLCARSGYVEESSFFFDIAFVDRALDGEESVAQTNDKDHGKFESFSLVDSGQAQAVFLFVGAAFVALGGEEDELGEEFLHRLVALGKADQ